MTKLTVVVDNQAKRSLRAAWGLSILVEGEKRIIFDTGPDSGVLEYNMKKMNLEGEVDYLIISHNHWDHIGGLRYAEKFAKNICLPERIETRGLICKNPTKIGNMGETTGVMGLAIKEQGLVVFGEEKNVLIVGCSHPGIENLVKRAHQIAGRIDVVIGGFHLLGETKRRLEKIAKVFKELDVEEIYGIHCTGNEAQRFFKERLGEKAKDGYAGLVLHF